jgi:hypothetical protein
MHIIREYNHTKTLQLLGRHLDDIDNRSGRRRDPNKPAI